MVKLPATNILFKNSEEGLKLMVSYSQIEMFQQCPYKWYKSYIEGMRSFEKQEATSYGTVIHQMLEYFFKNWRKPNAKDLQDAYNYFSSQEEIPFESIESGLMATKDACLLIGWISDLFKKGDDGEYVMKYDELSPVEKIIRKASAIGIEERFELPYKLPVPLETDEGTFTHVHINGSIDLHMGMKKNGKIHHYIVDWKSGKKTFDKAKLNHNLQHPIYAFYVMRKYGDGLPDMGIYFFTRMREYQLVKVDEERRDDAVKILNECFRKMYNFDDRSVSTFLAYIETENENGEKKYSYKYARLRDPLPENMKPCPSPLCYYCDFGKHKKNLCPYSSTWDPSKKKKKE